MRKILIALLFVPVLVATLVQAIVKTVLNLILRFFRIDKNSKFARIVAGKFVTTKSHLKSFFKKTSIQVSLAIVGVLILIAATGAENLIQILRGALLYGIAIAIATAFITSILDSDKVVCIRCAQQDQKDNHTSKAKKKKDESLVRRELLHLTESWETVYEEKPTWTTHYGRQGDYLGDSLSKSETARTALIRKHHYVEEYKCPDCQYVWSVDVYESEVI